MWPCKHRPASMLLLVLVAVVVMVGDVRSAMEARSDCRLKEAGVLTSVSPVSLEDGNGDQVYLMEAFWWGIDNAKDGDWIGIWNHDPLENIENYVDREPFNGSVDGQCVFNLQFNASLIPRLLRPKDSGACLPYWVAYIQEEKVVHSSCLKMQPNWMQQMQEDFQDQKLCDVLLPGTHDAGAATHYENWTMDGIVGDLVGRWTFTQDHGLWEQLVMGVRYMDMRISYYPDKKHLYYVNHGAVIIAPLYLYLQDVANFMRQTKEIVIFDIHWLHSNFNDYPEAGLGLRKFIEHHLSEWMAPNSYEPNPTLGELWASDKRMIVTYPSPPSELYWTPVYHLYGNVQNLDDLYNFFQTKIPIYAGYNSMWSSQTEFTARHIDVALNRWGGLTGAANITNLPVTLWLRRQWWQNVNIVSLDFVLGSGLVDIIIEGNKKKLLCKK